MDDREDHASLLASRLIQISEIMNRRVARLMEDFGNLKAVDIRLLIEVRRGNALSIAQLSRRTRIDRAWISRSVSRLVDEGLLATEDDATARSKAVRASDAGLAFVEQILPRFREEWGRAARGIDARLAAQMMGIVLENLSEIDE